MAFYRQSDKQTLLVIANYQKEAQSVTLEKEVKAVLLNNCKEIRQNGKEWHLEGYQAMVLEV